MHKYLSSEVDWCEPNFVHSHYVAETWNTLSSFVISIIGLYGIFIKNSFGTKVLYSLLIPIGITSAYFHGTLSLYGQLLDELSIMVLISCALYHYNWINNNISIKLLLTNLLQTYLLFYYPFYNRFMLFLYGFLCYNIINNNKHLLIKSTCNKAKSFFWLSLGLWLIDFLLCDYIGHVYGHALWHVFIGFTAYYSLKCVEDYKRSNLW